MSAKAGGGKRTQALKVSESRRHEVMGAAAHQAPRPAAVHSAKVVQHKAAEQKDTSAMLEQHRQSQLARREAGHTKAAAGKQAAVRQSVARAAPTASLAGVAAHPEVGTTLTGRLGRIVGLGVCSAFGLACN